ncbi:cytochrome P450 [Kineobactrum sediminis]|uniref:Cytochrome P450 n=1 Tax=Kineobactrum sediminis TaxID=1905677 RepID=A0A2N5Y1Y5_9GAMM|nr:cytochrome P450 [Kineobactrum sediminis]PLW82401.1 cytochrome P450 [Kineobactrum sediminis]
MAHNGTDLRFVYDPLQYEQEVPFAKIAQLRAQSPVVWVDEQVLPQWPGGKGFWFVTRHKECLEALKNARVFSSHLGGTQLRDPATPEDLAYVQQMMLNMDPPDHTRLRRMLINAFTSKAIKQLESRICDHARGIVDRVMDGRQSGECDFVKDIAADMPLLCLADIFGLPSEDRYLMFDWANRVIGYQDPEYSVSSRHDEAGGTAMAREALKLRPVPDADGNIPDPRSRRGMDDLYRYAHLLAEHKRAHPGSDVMSILLAQIDEEGGALTVAEFENMFWLFAVAGNETLRNAIPGGMVALLQHPQSWRALQNNPDAMPGAVDEMLRWWTPVMNFRRTASEDTVLGGVTIPAGDKVLLSFLSANHDERTFAEPSSFDIERNPNPHVSFGRGPHFCIGGQLAMAQMRALFTELTSRFESFELVGEPKFLRSNFQRGVKSLPVRWQARK